MKFYARTREGMGPEHWQPLEEHLHGVSELAGEFAEAFGSRGWGEIAGLWHDLGKYQEKFQDNLAINC